MGADDDDNNLTGPVVGPLDKHGDLGDAEGGVNQRNRLSNAGPPDPNDPFDIHNIHKRPKTTPTQTPQTPKAPKDVPDGDVAKPPRGGARR